MDHQDWKEVIIHGKSVSNNNQKTPLHKNYSIIDNKMKKLEDETENFTIKKVSTDLKTAIMKGRNAKKFHKICKLIQFK